MNQDLQFATIVTRDHYCSAKTWADSVRRFYPDSTISICLADSANQQLRKYFADYILVEISKLAELEFGISNYSQMAFQYTPFELTCALKPFVIRQLLNESSSVIYMDSDTLLFDQLTAVEELLCDSSVVLTPHLTLSADTTTEHRIRSAGTLNGGFVAVRQSRSANKFLNWWASRCETECYVDSLSGKFVDQTWLDLAISLFEGVAICRNESLNVAYWNIENRHLEKSGSDFFVNGDRLGFFHFSGFEREKSGRLSKHYENRLTNAVSEIVNVYENLLSANSHPRLQDLACEFNSYCDGSAIDPIHREAIRLNATCRDTIPMSDSTSQTVNVQQHFANAIHDYSFADIKNPFDLVENPGLPGRFEAARDQLILSRKEWQIAELQTAADRQNAWIKRKIHNRLDKRAIRAVKNVFQMFKKDAA